jgi:hypothetical protein
MSPVSVCAGCGLPELHKMCPAWGTDAYMNPSHPNWGNRELIMSDTNDHAELSNKPDGAPRHPSVAGVLKHFRHKHLPDHLQAISRPCGELAVAMANALPENPDLTCGLRDLLAAKDNFVRAKL